MSSFTAWDSTPSIKASVFVDGPRAWVGGCLRWPFWIKGMTNSLGVSEGFTLMWTQRREVGRVAWSVGSEPHSSLQRKHLDSLPHPQLLNKVSAFEESAFSPGPSAHPKTTSMAFTITHKSPSSAQTLPRTRVHINLPDG